MPDNRRRNILIGLFVLGGLACMGILIIKFGEAKAWFGKQYNITAKFSRIEGVREGTEVHLTGVWVGNVKKVELRSDRNNPYGGVDVIMEIDKKFDIPEGSVANVMSPLMGQAIIDILPRHMLNAPLTRNGSGVIMGTVTGPLDQVLPPDLQERLLKTSDEVQVLAKSLQPVADDLHELLRKRTAEDVESATSRPTTQEVTQNMYTAVDRLNNVLASIEHVLGDPQVQTNLRETITNLHDTSVEAKLAMGDSRRLVQNLQQTNTNIQKTISNTNEHIETLSQKLGENSDRLNTALGYFASAGRDLAEGHGTLGLFLRDSKFYEELFLTVQRLSAAAQDLQITVKQWRDAGFPVKLK